MAASWTHSRILGAKHKVFSWRIDNRGNLFIKRKFSNNRFPRVDNISCIHLGRLYESMLDGERKSLANDAAKLCMGTEKDGIGKFLYELRLEVSSAQLSSQLGAIFYQVGVWEWNEEKRGIKFLLLSENWQEKTSQYRKRQVSISQYYRDSLNSENESAFFENLLEPEGKEKPKRQKQEVIGEVQINTVQNIEQMKLSAFFRDYEG